MSLTGTMDFHMARLTVSSLLCARHWDGLVQQNQLSNSGPQPGPSWLPAVPYPNSPALGTQFADSEWKKSSTTIVLSRDFSSFHSPMHPHVTTSISAAAEHRSIIWNWFPLLFLVWKLYTLQLKGDHCIACQTSIKLECLNEFMKNLVFH